MSIVLPLRLDRLQEALVTVLDDALPSDVTVAWAYGEGLWESNFPTAQACNLTMVGGPSYHNRSHARGTLTTVPTSVLFTVDVAASGARYVVELNDFAYRYDASGGDTVTDVRDALETLIAADDQSPYSVAPSGADSLVVTPTTVGDLWQASVSQRISATPTLSSEYYLLTRGTRVFTVAVGLFSRGRAPRNGAWALTAQAEAAFEAEEYARLLSDFGVGVWGKGPATDLSELDNGHWLSRVQFDVTLAMQSVFTRQVSVIDDVDLTLTLSDPTATLEFTVGP